MFNTLKHNGHFQQHTKQKPRWARRSTLQTILLMSISSTALAIVPIPKETGTSGFINLGVLGATVESNILAEVVSVDLGSSTINSLNKEPDSKGVLLPSANFELSYTWADSRTQIYLGNQLEDFLRFDLTTNFGVRKEFGSVGIFALEAITTSVETKVWSDPYVTNVKRDNTAKTTTGARIIWDQILGSAAEIRISSVEIELDDERSGTGLGLTASDRALLNREGDINRVDIEYAFKLGKGRLFVPRLKFVDFDLDGEAMAHDGSVLELSYAAPAGELRYVTNLSFGKHEYDVVNPIYGIKDEADLFGFNATLIWPNIFGLKDWKGNASLLFFSKDHDIDFYDSQATAIRFGMIRRF